MQLHLHSNWNPPPATVTRAMMATVAGGNVDLNTISTLVAGVLTSLQSTTQANSRSTSSTGSRVSSSAQTGRKMSNLMKHSGSVLIWLVRVSFVGCDPELCSDLAIRGLDPCVGYP